MVRFDQKPPQTLQQAIATITYGLKDDELEVIRTKESGSVHHTFGMSIRNEWGLWDTKSPLNQDIQKRFGIFGHGDDCSALILAGAWASVRGENVEEVLDKQAKKIIRHWQRTGLDPKTGEKVSEPPSSFTVCGKCYGVVGSDDDCDCAE